MKKIPLQSVKYTCGGIFAFDGLSSQNLYSNILIVNIALLDYLNQTLGLEATISPWAEEDLTLFKMKAWLDFR